MSSESVLRQKCLDDCNRLDNFRREWLKNACSTEALKREMKKVDYSLMVKSGLSQLFDDIAQVGCVIEMLEASDLKHTSVSDIRRYAMECWERSIDNPDASPDMWDPLKLLTWEAN